MILLQILHFITLLYCYYKWDQKHKLELITAPTFAEFGPKTFLIIVNFHWPHYNQIDYVIRNVNFFQKYFKYQTDYICIGPANKTNGIKVYSNSQPPNGYYSYYSFNVAIKLQTKSYWGYIFMNDDSIINPFRFNKLNFTVPFGASYGVNSNSKGWWNPIRNHHNMTFWDAQTNFHKEIIENGIVNHNLTRYASYSDFFYVPSFYASYVANLFYYAMKNQVFLEMAVPTTLHSLNCSYSIPECQHGYNGSYLCLRLNFDHCIHMHPIKMTNEKLRGIIFSFYENMSRKIDQAFCYR